MIIARYFPLFAAASLLLAGCALPIDHTRTQVNAPSAWQAPGSADATANAQWWRQLGGEQLPQLMAQARNGNFDLAVARARLKQADALVRVAGGALLPQIDAQLTASRSRAVGESASSGYSALLSASYELDLWGANRANRQAAMAQSVAQRYQSDAIAISLDAAVAQTYLQIQASRQRAAVARLALANGEQMLAMSASRYRAGAAIGNEPALQEMALAALRQQVALLDQQASDYLGALAVLLGRSVQDVVVTGDTLDRFQPPPVDAGVPSSLLTRRPDLAALEHSLAASDADVAVARAALLPSVTLTAAGGAGSDHWRSMLRHSVFSLAAGITAPIFNNGQLQGERDYAEARREEALATYNAAIVTSFNEVETALNAVEATQQQDQQQVRAVAKAQDALRITASRQAAGAQTVLDVDSARAVLYTSQDTAIAWRLARLLASVSLYKAVGGDWQVASSASVNE